MVVLGHFIQIGLRNRFLFFQWMWVIIYSFHMPVFIFISGYFAKKHLDKNGKRLHRLAIQYILGCFLLCLIKSILKGELVARSILSPPFGMWYLLCLFFLYLILPWVVGIRRSFELSVLVALFVGCTDQIGSFLVLSRTICLLPFFLFGALLVGQEEIYKLRRMPSKRKRCLMVVWATVFATFLFFMYRSGMNYDILWLKTSYHNANMALLSGITARIFFFLSAFCTGIMLFMAMTQRRCFLSQWGRNSLSVYLLHLIVFYLVKAVMKHFMPYETIWIPGGLLVVASIGTVWLLSRDFVSDLVKKMVAFWEKLIWKGVQDEPE